jgi:hypothetical protein
VAIVEGKRERPGQLRRQYHDPSIAVEGKRPIVVEPSITAPVNTGAGRGQAPAAGRGGGDALAGGAADLPSLMCYCSVIKTLTVDRVGP